MILWLTTLGTPWEELSYDYLFRFGARTVTNKVVLIQMDDAACLNLGQSRTNWDRGWHARLVDHLRSGGCPLVVFDVFLRAERNPHTDTLLSEAIRKHGRVVLMEKLTEPQHPLSEAAQVMPPLPVFADAAAALGIGRTDAELGGIARRHWPFPASGEGPFVSLPWAAARLAGAHLSDQPREQWLRYYGAGGAWEAFSYHLALSNSPSYFRDKVVFVGSKPSDEAPNLAEADKFSVPHTRWSGKAAGGLEVMATTFLNLINEDWLRRPAKWIEFGLLLLIGGTLAWGLCLVRPLLSVALAVAAMVVATAGGITLSYYSNWWFPWLLVAGAQVPCSLGWALVSTRLFNPEPVAHNSSARGLAWALAPDDAGGLLPTPPGAAVSSSGVSQGEAPRTSSVPDAPDYELFDPPFGEGSFGKVWVVRNAVGQWQALKAVYQSRFGSKTSPYEAEFKGIKRYKPVSDKHPGLLRVDFVTRKKSEGYFYYVMELGDPQAEGWEAAPHTYKPRDLTNMLTQAPLGRLPITECRRIGIALADALDFLHRQGLTHRDIKPSNIIFVGGIPKLADVGLVTEIKPDDQMTSWGGTPGYMPPPPEPPGTVQADLYALGKVLYVISTGQNPRQFPNLPADLAQSIDPDFSSLLAVILKACHADLPQRFQSADELRQAL